MAAPLVVMYFVYKEMYYRFFIGNIIVVGVAFIVFVIVPNILFKLKLAILSDADVRIDDRNIKDFLPNSNKSNGAIS